MGAYRQLAVGIEKRGVRWQLVVALAAKATPYLGRLGQKKARGGKTSGAAGWTEQDASGEQG